VFEADQIAKAFGPTTVIRDFSTRVVRGDRVGLIGPNGAGKTTLLRILLGEIEPDSGDVRRGVNVQVAYYDQQREQLDPERTVMDTVGDGNDTVTVAGRSRHIMGYLQDFLFAPQRARSPVKALSGGERNRLLLARLFTKPANVLVLDEPTNDLDLETLELLEAQLVEWPGTLLLVSHDRRFLDNVVTSTIAFEGEGRVAEYVGGYEDWLRQRPQIAVDGQEMVRDVSATEPVARAFGPAALPKKRKLTFNEQRELARLPADIAQLEAELKDLEARSHSADFYKEGAETIRTALSRIEAINEQLLNAYARWDELDSVGK
jgi:ATP-binding cassette subfamily F protein uup